ncbi:hypothetical protein DH2020_022129 [Rehmannia glutinosa]|uniref:PCI domain-containing protein n=1 Tax=Rehmannia glutinosa TaxID=99300 RepID=A0ABR0WGW6_REHGL
MNQGESTDTITSIEKHQINDSQQVHGSSYFSPNCAVASWNTQGENHSLRENGVLSNSGYNHDQLVEPTLKNVQDGMSSAPVVSTSSSIPANVAQGYGGYAAYPNTDPYGYSSTGYAAYYNQYQPQPSQYQQQPSQYQPQSNQYQQQSDQYQQQTNQSYPHHVGAYQNTGAPYQPLSSIQNTGSYAGPASYSNTYYNPGDYQTSGSYTSGNYGTQTNLWDGGQYATYSSHQYQNYTQDSNSAYSSTTAVATPQYQQPYKQWEDYYNQTQTEVSCAPGTENISVSVAYSLNSSVPSGSTAYTAPSNQMPTAYTPLWRPESSSSEMTSMQGGYSLLDACKTWRKLEESAAVGSLCSEDDPISGNTPEGYWKHGASAFQHDPPNAVQPHAQKPQDVIPAYESSQNQQSSTFSQGSTALYPASYQVSQSHPSSFQAVSQPCEPLDSRKASKLQIPTNPRIASNLPSSQSKIDKDGSMTSAAAKPAYISVPMQKPNAKVIPHEEADPMLKPVMFPKSLRGYVERALARCKNDRQKAACQAIMKEVITKATADGTLYTKDWDIEPLFPMPDSIAVDKDDTHSQLQTSAMPKSKSPSRRAKSRWEPIPEEKVVDKSSDISPGTAKYGGWNNKKFSGGKIENKDNFGTKFSVTYQKSLGKNAARPAKKQRLGEDLNAADDGETSSDSDKEPSLTKYYSAATALADSPEEKKRRENRSKRFDKGNGNRAEKTNIRAKDVGAGNLYARRASAVVLSRTFDESGSRAVEDIDWDALTVKGTCQEIEKRYLRLTSAPDPATVRPEEVLEKALLMVQNSQKNYLYKCDQLKSIRQDLTVQHIRNELTVKVYETHARLAIEVGDLPEYNQGPPVSNVQEAGRSDGVGAWGDSSTVDIRLSADAKKDKAVKHALSVRSAVTSGNYVMFFRLYKTAPNLNTLLMDLYVEKMRYAAVKCMLRSYRPTVPVSYLSQILGFTNALPTSEASDEKELDAVEECMEWLKAHGACLISDGSGETLLDTKELPFPFTNGSSALFVYWQLVRSFIAFLCEEHEWGSIEVAANNRDNE